MKYLRPAYAVVLLLLTAAVLIGVVLWGAYKNITTLAVMISLFVLFVSYLTAVLLLNKAGKKQLTQNAARFRAALPYAETIRIRHQGIVAVRQRLITLHCFLFFVRAKIRA